MFVHIAAAVTKLCDSGERRGWVVMVVVVSSWNYGGMVGSYVFDLVKRGRREDIPTTNFEGQLCRDRVVRV